VKRLSVLLALAFALALLPAVSAQPMKPLRCESSIYVDWDAGVWKGTVTGDISGSITITPGVASYPGATEHFFETWGIKTASGSIWGFDEGVWSFKNFKWITNGRVTGANGTWTYLVGCKMHTSGTTSPFLGPGYPLTGVGTMTIIPGSHG